MSTTWFTLNPTQARILEDLARYDAALPRRYRTAQRDAAMAAAPFTIARSYSIEISIDDLDLFRQWLLVVTSRYGQAGAEIDDLDDDGWQRRKEANEVRARFANVGVLTDDEADEMRYY